MRRLYTALSIIVAILLVVACTTVLKAVSSSPIGVRKAGMRTFKADGTYTVPLPKPGAPGHLTRMPFLPSDPRKFGVVTVTI